MDGVYYSLYKSAHNNAVDLLEDAKILLARGKYSTSYFLAVTAIEEMSKSQASADVVTGFITESEFWKMYQNHCYKIQRADWAYERFSTYPGFFKQIGPDEDDLAMMSPSPPEFEKRNKSIYVCLDKNNNEISFPQKSISEKDAGDLIFICEQALTSIVIDEEVNGYPIGTKRFLK